MPKCLAPLAFGFELFEAVHHLLFGHAVLGFTGLVHHLEAFFALSQAEGAAGVIPAEHRLGHAGHPVQEAHHGGVVQVDVGPQFTGLFHILAGGLVGGKHDLLPAEAHGLAQHQLGQGRAVHPAAFLPQDLQDRGVGQGLDRKVFLEALVPAERLVDAAGVGADGLLIVDVEGGRHVGQDLLHLGLGQEWSFFHGIHVPLLVHCFCFSWSRTGVKVGIIFCSCRTTPSSLCSAAWNSSCSS